MQNINEILESVEQEEQIDIKGFLFRLLNKWYWFVIFGFIGLCAGWLITKRSPSIYKMSASVLINDESNKMSVDKFFYGFNPSAKTNAERHILMLKSYTLNHLAIKKINIDVSWYQKGIFRDIDLYHQAPYTTKLISDSINKINTPVLINPINANSFELSAEVKDDLNNKIEITLQGNYGQPIYSKYFNLIIDRNKNKKVNTDASYYFIINNLDDITKSYVNGIAIDFANENGDGIALSLQERNAQRGVDYMNELISVYLKHGLNEKNRTAENTVRFIDAQLENLIDSLNKAGELFTEFRSKKGIVDLSKQATMVAEKLQELETEKKMAERKIEYFKNLHQYMGNAEEMKLMASPSVAGITDAGINAQVVKLAELYSQRISLTSTVKDRNPAIVMINEQISNTIKSLEENIKNLLNNTEVELQSIKSQLNTSKIELANLPKTEQDLINIKRSFDLNNELYTYLLQKRAEAAITKASNVPDANVLDPARIETVIQTGPKGSTNILIGLLLGLAIPFIFIIITDYFNDSIKSIEELQKLCKLPISAEIAHNNYNIEVPVQKYPRSGIAETFRGLRVSLQYMANNEASKVVAIHSMISGEGKTFCALNLSNILAMDNKKVLLVGCDLRKPKLHKVFEVENAKGLSTFLIGNDGFNDIIRSTDQENLFYVNSGPVPPNPSELIGNGNFKKFIDQAQKEFDYIVLDNAPITLVIDGFLVAKYADINLAVVRQGYSHKKQINYINQLKDKKDFKHPGVLLNDTVYSGYGNSYKSYYGYGKGYYDDSYEVMGFVNKLKKKFRKG